MPAVIAQLRPPDGFRADLAAVGRRRIDGEATADPACPVAATGVPTLRHREVLLAGARPEDLITVGAAVDRAVERFPARRRRPTTAGAGP